MVLPLPLQGYAPRAYGTRRCARGATAETALQAGDAGTPGPSQWDTRHNSLAPDGKTRKKEDTMQYLESAPLRSARAPLARWIRGSAAALLTLAAPALSFSGALTTGLHGTAPAVGFPPGYGVSLAATVAVTTLAAVLAALVAGRDALIAIPVSLGMWAIIGLGVVAAGLELGHQGLTGWGAILAAASVIGAAAGMLLAAIRLRAGR